jgi:hypothetical protein
MISSYFVRRKNNNFKDNKELFLNTFGRNQNPSKSEMRNVIRYYKAKIFFISYIYSSLMRVKSRTELDTAEGEMKYLVKN